MRIYMKKIIILTVAILCLFNTTNAEELIKQQSKYPDYAYMYLGPDKFEKINRKMFNFNLGLNKYVIRPVHILWSSIMPEYGIDRIQSAYKNIEYPKRLVSSLVQKDFKTSGTETVRFLTNTTLGLGGMFDPAKSIFHIESTTEDMEQALTKCKCCSGPYIVLPVMNGTTTRGITGKLLDTALNPTTYIATPVLAMVKAGLTVNRTSYMQPLLKMIESTYADPYEISRKMYALDNFIKSENLDRKETLEKSFQNLEPINDLPADVNPKLVLDTPPTNEVLTVAEILKGGANIDNIILKNYGTNDNVKLFADIMLFDYNPQNPVIDSMRTALFDLPEINKSIWNELSIWNRSFSKKIKTSSVNVTPDKENYKFKYIMQKDKNAPLAIIYPSIGEGIQSHHALVMAKLFYDEGYSVVIQGSHFQWEFVKSMPADYHPGIPTKDIQYLKNVTAKIIDKLETKYECEFPQKTVMGTSMGAMAALFLADSEYKNNTLGITKYISVCPPIELLYAMEQFDRNSEEWRKNQKDFKKQVAETASKIAQLINQKNESKDFKIDTLPFSETEGKLITGFVMHQKLSDLVFTIENIQKYKATDIYTILNNMNYRDYMEKYLLTEDYDINTLAVDTSLLSLADFLQNSNNYKIYHSIDDYLVNQNQLKRLKVYSGKNTILFSNGAHLGFMYTPEFLENLKNEISLNEKTALSN